jgi:MFS family permease
MADAHGHREQGEGLGYRGWRTVFASMAALAFGPSTVAVLGLSLFIKPLQKDFGWTLTEVSAATMIISYMVAVVSPLQGWLVDRFGVRRVMLPSIPAFALGIAGLAFMRPVHWLWYAAWVAIPILGVGLFPLAYLKGVSTWFSKRLGLALGVTNAGVAIGQILVPLIAGFLIARYGWRTAYLGLAAIVLFVTLPVVFAFVRERPAAAPGRAAAPLAAGASFAEAVRTPTFGLLALAFLCIGIMNTAMIVQQVPLLIDRGMPPPQAAGVAAWFGLFGLLGRLLTGLMLDRFPATRVMIAFLLGAALACALYALGAAGGLAYVCSALIGLLFGAEFDVLGYMIKGRFGTRAFGKLYGAIFAVFQFGAGFGAVLLPWTRQSLGSYAPGLWAFTALLLLAALAVGCVRGGFKSEMLADVPA